MNAMLCDEYRDCEQTFRNVQFHVHTKKDLTDSKTFAAADVILGTGIVLDGAVEQRYQLLTSRCRCPTTPAGRAEFLR